MDYIRICRWLGLPTDQWPPNHYELLGLDKSQEKLVYLEVHVQERLRLVRSYQLSHPELATEAMNRLAEAYACLSDPTARERYNRQHGFDIPAAEPPPVRREETPAPLARPMTDTVTHGMPTVVIWTKEGSPPVRQPSGEGAQSPEVSSPPLGKGGTGGDVPGSTPPYQGGEKSDTFTAASTPSKEEAEPEPPDPVLVAAQKSWRAWKGMWTRATLEERLAQTQSLLQAWRQLKRYLGHADHPLHPRQRKDLQLRLERVDRLRDAIPLLLGEPGQPGYRVAILARDENPPRAFQEMGADERELLAQDWKKSGLLLSSHIEFLETELRELNREGVLVRSFRPVRSFLVQRAGWFVGAVLVGIALIGLWVLTHR